MGLPAQSTVSIDDFLGLVNNVDERSIPTGAAQQQINAACVRKGEVNVRYGVREITFDAEP